MAEKLDHKQIHVLRLIHKGADEEGWAPIGDIVYKTIPAMIPKELAIFEQTEAGGRARLTQEGSNLLSAMEWL